MKYHSLYFQRFFINKFTQRFNYQICMLSYTTCDVQKIFQFKHGDFQSRYPVSIAKSYTTLKSKGIVVHFQNII